MTDTADVIVIGAGHNGLTVAAYLRRAGLSVIVLEAAAHAGGNATTIEPLLPGFRHNPHANYLTFCDVMPLTDDLALKRYGLRLEFPDAQLGFAFSDGRPPVILHRHDLIERTSANLAVYSRQDAMTYAELKRRSRKLGSVIRQGMYAPPSEEWFVTHRRAVEQAFGDMFTASTLGRGAARRLIDDLFRSPEARMLLYQLAIECGVGLNEAGSDLAFLGYVIWIAGRWRLPVGGMQRLSDAIANGAQSRGADLRLGIRVDQIIVANGVAIGVRTADGGVVTAAKAVIAAMPIMELADKLIERHLLSGREQADLTAFEREQGGTVATTMYCLREPPRYTSARHDADIDRCFKTIIGHESPEEILSYLDEIQAGLLPRPAGAVRLNSLWDPSQARAGRHVAGVDSMFPPTSRLTPDQWTQVEAAFPDAFYNRWAAYARNLTSASVLAMRCDATARFERRMMMRMGPAQYRTSIGGLYVCGPGTYPGGGVHGACGYNAYGVIVRDLGIRVA